jgi:hypothetical protein
MLERITRFLTVRLRNASGSNNTSAIDCPRFQNDYWFDDEHSGMLMSFLTLLATSDPREITTEQKARR